MIEPLPHLPPLSPEVVDNEGNSPVVLVVHDESDPAGAQQAQKLAERISQHRPPILVARRSLRVTMAFALLAFEASSRSVVGARSPREEHLPELVTLKAAKIPDNSHYGMTSPDLKRLQRRHAQQARLAARYKPGR